MIFRLLLLQHHSKSAVMAGAKTTYNGSEWTELYSTGAKKLTQMGYVERVLHPQIRELLDRYQPDGLWADGHWHHSAEVWRSAEILALLASRNIPTNDRWGKDFSPDQYPLAHATGADRLLTPPGSNRPWEHVNTIGESWGYARQQRHYKTPSEVMALCTQVRSKGGRFTLNLGLQADGSMDPQEAAVLQALRFTAPTIPKAAPVVVIRRTQLAPI